MKDEFPDMKPANFDVPDLEVLRQALAFGLNQNIFDTTDRKRARALLEKVRAAVGNRS